MANSINATSTGNGGIITTGDDSGVLNIQTNETTAISIDASQNVGVGTSSPDVKLSVNGGIDAGPGSVSIPAYGFYPESTYGSTGMFAPAANTVAFSTSGGERMRIDSSGNLLVGTTTASGLLTVKGAGATSGSYSTYVTNSSGTVVFGTRNDGYIFMPSTYGLTTGNAANFFINSDGSVYRSTSSLKYKTDVQDATHGLTELLTLRSVTYKGKSESDADKTFGGLIAEEIHAAGLTEFVQYAEDGTPDALAYGPMVSLCIKAIQEQQAQISSQAAVITTLTERITALEGEQA